MNTTLYQFRYAFSKNIKIINSRLYDVDLMSDGLESVAVENAFLRKIKIIGRHSDSNNQVCLSGEISNTTINISGIGNQIVFEKDCRLNNLKIILNGVNCKILIKKNTTIGGAYLVCMGNGNTITIGEECMLADGVEIWASDSHPIFDAAGTLQNPSKSVVIGNHVWIGRHTTILKGVTIADNAIIGMKSLVTKNVDARTLNVGSPSRAIRRDVNWERDFITKYEV